MKKNIKIVTLVTFAIATTLFLMLAQANAQVIDSGQLTYSAPQNKYSIVNDNQVKLINTTKSIDVPFAISENSPTQYNAAVNFNWNARMQSNDTNKVVSVNYTIICNGKRLQSFRQDFVGISDAYAAGSYPYIINNDALKNGENQLTIEVAANTISEGLKPSGDSLCNFELEVGNVSLNLVPIDIKPSSSGFSDSSLLTYLAIGAAVASIATFAIALNLKSRKKYRGNH